MPRKGLSYEEKQKRMQEFFLETKGVYTLKELEKTLPKTKGIVQQSVKDVLESLVNDNLVMMEKVGSSNLFWMFPSQALVTRKRILDGLQEEKNGLQEKRSRLETESESMKKSRSGSDTREDDLVKHEKLSKTNAELKEKIELLKENDPETLLALENHTKVCRESAIRWTDNVYNIRSWCIKKFNVEGKRFDQGFGVPASFDYPEFK